LQTHVEILGGRLVLGVEGEGLFPLVPIAVGRFRLEGAPGFMDVLATTPRARRLRVVLGSLPPIELTEVPNGAAGAPARRPGGG
jgi:hypothetical protein